MSGLTGVGRDVTERTRAEEILPQVYRNAVEECRICPSLAPLAGAIAGATRRVRIGTAVVIAPFEHPLRIAEEWAEIDILSGGRALASDRILRMTPARRPQCAKR